MNRAIETWWNEARSDHAPTSVHYAMSMAIRVRFSFVCAKRFAELPGADPSRRMCDDCNVEVVNLDVLSEDDRERLFRGALRTGQRLCVSASVPIEDADACARGRRAELTPDEMIDVAITAGEPVIDDEMFGEEDVDGHPEYGRE
jgi:hypothetical protein